MQPKKLAGVKGIYWSSRKSAGSIILPLYACKPRLAHLGILAFMPDQWSQAAIIVNIIV